MAKKNVFSDDNQEQLYKAKRNIIILLMFSVTMLFLGLMSAYIVSMGDAFWLKTNLPTAFYISTVVIILSSVVIHLGLKKAESGQTKSVKWFVIGTFVLGLLFTYFQFKGYGQLVKEGVHFTGQDIVVTQGRYGSYFEVKSGDQFIEVNGNDYLIDGKVMSDAQMKKLQLFMGQFSSFDPAKDFEVKEYGKPYTLLYKKRPMSVSEGKLITKKGENLSSLDRERLYFLARNIQLGRGDFFVKGKLGEDFKIYFGGEEIEYKDRKLYRKGKELSPYQQLKAVETSDLASSYLYIITFLHLLHVLLTLVFLIGAVKSSFSGVLFENNSIRLKTTTMFWHFLGGLWVFLLLFLLFIH